MQKNIITRILLLLICLFSSDAWAQDILDKEFLNAINAHKYQQEVEISKKYEEKPDILYTLAVFAAYPVFIGGFAIFATVVLKSYFEYCFPHHFTPPIYVAPVDNMAQTPQL